MEKAPPLFFVIPHKKRSVSLANVFDLHWLSQSDMIE